jgi:hypothetical protein
VVKDARVEELLADAGAYLEWCLSDTASGAAANETLVAEGIEDRVIREFGIGFAPVGPDEYMNHLRGVGYDDDEIVAAGLATRSPRGRAHAHFRSRVMFPVRDRSGRVLGFAGLATHVGPSWALWITSPDAGLYRRSRAVFGLDRAAKRIRSSKTALVVRDGTEVLRAHQEKRTNTVAVHTGSVTREQMDELAAVVPGGLDALELDLAPGMTADRDDKAKAANPAAPARPPGPAPPPPRHLELKKMALVTATALAAMNTWTGAPLLALWLGSKAQGGRVLSLLGVVTVLVVMSVLVGLLAWALMWLNSRYDRLTGRPATAALTSPWHRAKRGDRVQDIRSRYGVSAPEKAVVGCVVAGVVALEIWFFLFAEAPF